MHPKTMARRAAVQALMAIEADSTPLVSALDQALRTSGVPQENRGFAREIVSGVLRHQALIDWTLEPLLNKPLGKLDAPVRAAMRLAAYERAWLATPDAAVANEYTGLARQLRLSSAAGFVNAVARRLPPQPRAVPDDWSDLQKIAVEFSHPSWMVERWLPRLGAEECAELCRSNNQIAPLHVRVNTMRAASDEVLRGLQSRGLKARSGRWSPDAIVVDDAGNPVDWPEWRSGAVYVQDEAAQLVALFANPPPGSLVVDCAAAPGGKATHLAQMMGDEGLIIACDAAPGRIKLVEENARRLHLASIAARAGDLRSLAQALPLADLVLLDAPCLGTGTLRRRPDAKHRKTPEQLAELAALQDELLNAAALLVKPVGQLVYSTCSLEPEENELQIRRFMERNPEWCVVPAQADAGALRAETVNAIASADGFLQTWPHRHDCDGMFAAKLTKSPRGN